MTKDNKKLLEEVINNRLHKSLSENEKEATAAFEEAMQALDRQAELDKSKNDKIMKLVEIGAIVIAAPLIDAGCKKAFAHMICEFEKDYNFTTTAGKTCHHYSNLENSLSRRWPHMRS